MKMWPTPHGNCHTGAGGHGEGGANLQTAVMWNTPAAQDAKNATLPESQKTRDTLPGDVARSGAKGALNPDWVEALMGLPVGWTDVFCDNDDLRQVPWPAGYGQEQYPWEPPRTTTKKHYRAKRLRALGNGVVPAQIAPVFAELARIESALRDEGNEVGGDSIGH
ncbi:hypothetical protein [Alicyclobacillus macrosporangiidus]|uniref:hypothetical protein n=1 Tax=Alicyclobacillus macrosporangiidus TaxID=392015 RepID=UPI000497216C|nr:hypothetical protein [Alicyclobacillus macrosporangiidus]